ncbi:MAG: flavin monoamine oxidase family protein [Rhizobiaceae bacterium]
MHRQDALPVAGAGGAEAEDDRRVREDKGRLLTATERTEIVIAGAGFAGLSAAAALREAGRDVLVIEARDRVGGRVSSRLNGLGERYDSGGQFLCDDMVEVVALAKRFGKTFVTTPVEGEFVVQPPMSDDEAAATYRGSIAIRARQKALDPSDPAIAGLTVAAWLQRQSDAPAAKSAYRSMIEGLWCQALERIPLWHLADNDRRITNEESELQYFLRETMHSLAEDLARSLGPVIRLNTPLRTVEHRADGVRLAADGLTVEARQAVVAMPLSRSARLRFEPALPPELTRALSVWDGGGVAKLKLRYATPFWRDAGLSGMVMWRDLHGLFACDSSADDGHAALTVFVGGPLGEAWLEQGEEATTATVLEKLVAALGPRAADTVDIALDRWTGSEWDGGGYGDLILDVSARDAETVLLAGHGPVHFASSDIAPTFPGYVEGAIAAGRAAAMRVLERG